MWFERVTLRPGSEGPSVVALRRLLRRLGFAPTGPSARDDGAFDEALRDAVRAFQAAHGLVPDGIVGPATWRRLLELQGPADAAALHSSSPASPWSDPHEQGVHVHVSLRERRLTLHMWVAGGQGPRWRVAAFPAAVGGPASPTPPGVYTVCELIACPGPPLGSRWIRLHPSGSIHGAAEPWRVGQAATCGCVQLYNKDVEFVFHRLSLGTPVVIE